MGVLSSWGKYPLLYYVDFDCNGIETDELAQVLFLPFLRFLSLYILLLLVALLFLHIAPNLYIVSAYNYPLDMVLLFYHIKGAFVYCPFLTDLFTERRDLNLYASRHSRAVACAVLRGSYTRYGGKSAVEAVDGGKAAPKGDIGYPQLLCRSKQVLCKIYAVRSEEGAKIHARQRVESRGQIFFVIS